MYIYVLYVEKEMYVYMIECYGFKNSKNEFFNFLNELSLKIV